MITDTTYEASSQDNIIFELNDTPDNQITFNGRDYVHTIHNYSKHNQDLAFLDELFSHYRYDRKHTIRANVIKNTTCFTCRRFQGSRYKNYLETLLVYISIAGRYMCEGRYDTTRLKESDVQTALNWFKVLNDDRLHFSKEILCIDALIEKIKESELDKDEFSLVVDFLEHVRIGSLNSADDLFIFITERLPQNRKDLHSHLLIANILCNPNPKDRPEVVILSRLILAVSISIDLYDDDVLSILYNLFNRFITHD